MYQGFILAACLLWFAPPVAAADCTATRPSTVDIMDEGLLTPSVPIERRKRLSDRLLCSALAGNAASQELAGTLYYQGQSRKGNVLTRDMSRARHMLTAAANRGRRHAMHRLAELELSDGHLYEAALWTRVEYVMHGLPLPPLAQLNRTIEARVSRDSRLEADVLLKVAAIHEAMEAPTP
jgi:TPR repeat protein